MAEMMAVKNCLAWIADEQVSDIVRRGPLVGTFREHSLITIIYSCEGHIESTKVLPSRHACDVYTGHSIEYQTQRTIFVLYHATDQATARLTIYGDDGDSFNLFLRNYEHSFGTICMSKCYWAYTM